MSKPIDYNYSILNCRRMPILLVFKYFYVPSTRIFIYHNLFLFSFVFVIIFALFFFLLRIKILVKEWWLISEGVRLGVMLAPLTLLFYTSLDVIRGIAVWWIRIYGLCLILVQLRLNTWRPITFVTQRNTASLLQVCVVLVVRS